MNENIPFQTIDWSHVTETEHAGTTGMATWQTMLMVIFSKRHPIRMRRSFEIVIHEKKTF
jgi:hypothetical protein